MQLAALVQSPEHVCCRYRLAAFVPFLEGAGHRLQLLSWPRSAWGWLTLGRDLANADAVVVQRQLPSSWQLGLLRRAARRLVFDFDDAVCFRDSYSARGIHSARRLRRFRAIIRAADAVVAGNFFLAGLAARWTAAQRIHHIPTCVDPDRYPLAEHRRRAADVQLVWVGSSSTLQGLEACRPMLEAVGQSLPGLRLKVICDRFPQFDHLSVVPCPWSADREAAELADADIGISWLPDDPWSRGKCALKVLQYFAAGLPVVANPVGVQGELVDEQTGCRVQGAADWIEAITRLAGDPARRRRLGRQARRRVEAEFSLQAGADAWLDVLRFLTLAKERAG